MKPHGVQIKRGEKFPPNTKSVTRNSIFGNPFTVKRFGRTNAVRLHRYWLEGTVSDWYFREIGFTRLEIQELDDRRIKVLKRLPELKGFNLG